MTNTISLIGMPGAGKSVVGSELAAHLGWEFLDTDRQIETAAGTSLQQLLDESGYLALRSVEEKHILSLAPTSAVIATGGSVVYSELAMEHLRRISTVVFLDIDLPTVMMRINNFGQRGIASAANQTLAMIYAERLPLYRKFAAITVPNSSGTARHAVTEIIQQLTLNGHAPNAAG
jgi:shikimate kinase